MATSKSLTTAMQYQNNATSPVAISYSCQPEVSGGNLVAGHHRERPGVFTAGTPQECYGTNVNEDSTP